MNKIDHRRLRAVIKWYAAESGKTQQEIAESLGYSNQSFFSQVLNGYKDIPKALPGKIVELDKRLNIDYINGISEDMLLPGNVQPNIDNYIKQPKPQKEGSSSGVILPGNFIQMFSDLSATVRSQQETISLLVRATLHDNDSNI